MTERQEGCLLLSAQDAWALREVVLPYSAPVDGPTVASFEMLEDVQAFCKRLYETILRIELEKHEFYNMAVSERDCLVINQFLKPDMYRGAKELLVQTFLALHEQHYANHRLATPGAVVLEVWEVVEEDHALHHAANKTGTQAAEAADPG